MISSMVSFLDDFPPQRHPLAIQFPDHGPVAWIKKFGIDIVADEIEKGRELGKTNSFGVGFVAFGESVQEGEDVFWRDLVDGSITKFLDVPFDDGPVGSHRIFFSNGSCGNRSRFWLLWKVSWQPPWVKGLTIRVAPKVSL
jgi:hypothetical protein